MEDALRTRAEIAKLAIYRRALMGVRSYVWNATEGDRNPNRGDLSKIDRIAHQGLLEAEEWDEWESDSD